MLMAKGKIWIAVGLATVLAVAIWQWRAEIEKRVTYMVQGAQMEQALKEAEQRAEEARLEQQRIEEIAVAREKELQKVRQREREFERRIRELERDDAEAAEWLGTRVPGGVLDSLRGLDAPGADNDD